jgi:dipeptidyl aminopeptidase/acylaminoacyl peptidase
MKEAAMVWRLIGVLPLAVAALVLGGGAHATTQTVFNGRIAFTDVTGIASMNPDGSGQWGLDLVVGDDNPVWSPDGTRVAFTTYRNGDEDIYSMAPDGSDQKELTFSQSYDSDPTWSPDGKAIAFISFRADGSGIYVMNADGSDQHLLAAVNGYPSHPSWSPDGRSIAFHNFSYDYSSGTDRSGIWVLTGQDLHPLTTGPDDNPAWSPDGTKLAFDSTRAEAGNTDIYVMNADGTGITRLTTDIAPDTHPVWSPDGNWIAFVSGRASKISPQIFVMRADGSDVRQLTTGDGNTDPSWQPLGPPPEDRCSLWGTSASDLLVGGDGADQICGGAGNDTLIGMGGSDWLRGGPGDDYLAGGQDGDILEGGPGNDTIDARDGLPDYVDGGPGTDKVITDWTSPDVLKGIEQKQRSRDVAAWRPVTASSFEPTNPAVRAVDGSTDDWWNSGGPAPRWIEIDLLRATKVSALRLWSSPQPLGSVSLVLGKGAAPDAPFRQLARINGPTGAGQELDFVPKHAWRGIRVVRIESTSAGIQQDWIAWQEIQVVAARR